MGCSTSSANAVRNLDTDTGGTENNVPIETSVSAIKETSKVITKVAQNGVRKSSKSSINTVENEQNLARIDDETRKVKVNKLDRLSLSSSSSSSSSVSLNSALDYPDIINTEHGKKHRSKLDPEATLVSKNNNNKNKMSDEEVDIDLNDPEVGKAAVKIQAGFKNFMASKKKKETVPKQEEEPIVDKLADIDLNDPDVEKAATKIQATFRGYKTRKDHQIEAK